MLICISLRGDYSDAFYLGRAARKVSSTCFIGQCVPLDINVVLVLVCCSCGSYALAFTLALVLVHSTVLEQTHFPKKSS